MTRSYDLIVIGAGMAGVSAANKCASAGWKVAIVDALPTPCAATNFLIATGARPRPLDFPATST